MAMASARRRLNSSPTPMYAQLSSILRSKVMRGEWPEGFEIPTLFELAEQYDVARITARQATQILVAEGLLSSQRGRRTHVSYKRPDDGGADPLFTSIGSVLSARPNYSIRILERAEVETLPDGWFGGQPAGPYVRIRKVDCEGGRPYAYSVNFVRQDVFERLPPEAMKKGKLSPLVRDYADPPLTMGRERIRVAAADYEEAEQIQCAMSDPVAHVDRVFTDEADRIVYFGRFVYRGDRYAVEHDITTFVIKPIADRKGSSAPRGPRTGPKGRPRSGGS
jgi:GntR family transcriptional regulator